MQVLLGQILLVHPGHWLVFVVYLLFWLIYLAIPPLLTMRLFAEERGSGTLELLMTSPLRDWQVVLSKYVACFAFYAFLWLPTLAYLPVLPRISNHTDFDALRAHPDVDLQFVGPGQPMPQADLIILPGSKNTRADLDSIGKFVRALDVSLLAHPSTGCTRRGHPPGSRWSPSRAPTARPRRSA